MSNLRHAVAVNRTKLYRPPVTADYISRDELDNRLEGGISLPLTLVAAPAGYGKSTLISHWLETTGYPGAWLSLDESDSDIRVFLTCFIMALRTVSSEACDETLGIVNAEGLPPLPVVAMQLSNDLEELDERVIMVLDDYHRIHDSDVHVILEYLLEHPSRNLHLAILSRRDPVLSIATLRARHLLNEVRVRDLEFSKNETLALLGRIAGTAIEESSIERLQSNMEGWPVGVRLAALALQNQDNVEEFLNHFGADARPLQEYLVEEVLSRQPSQVLDCLLMTSILDRFNASLCEAVWNDGLADGNTPPSGKEFINRLEDSGLFCVALDGRHNWFRYHHIFCDLLQKQLEANFHREEITRLHQRASQWFAENSHFEEAIQHALAGGDDEGAAGIVGYARHELMNRDQWPRLERWFKLFSPQAIGCHPQLMVLRSWLDLSHWYRLDNLLRDLDQTDTLLENSSIDVHEAGQLKAEASVIRSSLAYWTANPAQAVALTEPALRDSPGEQEYVQSVALMYQIGSHQLLGDIPQAERLIWDHMEEEGFNSPGSQARLMQALCFVCWPEVDTRKLHQAASRLLQISQDNELSWSYSFARYFLGLGHYDRNELDDAVAMFEAIVNDPYRYPIQNVTHCSFLLSLCYQALGFPGRAREVANSINRLTIERGNRMFIDLAVAFQAELDLRQGRIAQAEQWAQSFVTPVPHVLHRFFNAELTSIRVMMARDAPDGRKAAAERLDVLHDLLSQTHHRRLSIDILGMKALLAGAEGDARTAITLLHEAVLLGQPGQLIRPLADLGPGLIKLFNQLDLDREGLQYVGTILSVLQQADQAVTLQSDKQSLLEPLSQRELEILELFAKNLSNKLIAEQLFISTGTVKRHAHNIYNKLSVSGRRDAVSKAIGLGILRA
jgi:LuxR family maltose regulon positive regulatory protein